MADLPVERRSSEDLERSAASRHSAAHGRPSPVRAAPGGTPRAWSRLNWAVIGFSLLLALPFLNQAFHVDDPNFLALASHARPDPLQLYRFLINWGGRDEWAFDILANPPLVPWYLALIGPLAAGREWVYHLFFLPFLAVTLVGIQRLGARFAATGPLLPDSPLLSGLSIPLLLGAVAPSLMLASHTVMPDLPLLASYTLGISLAVQGMDTSRPSQALLGAFLAGLSGLCRYSGLTAVPLLCLYVFLHRVRLKLAIPVLLTTLLPLGLWSVASYLVYGRLHYLTIAGFEGQTLGWAALGHKVLYQLVSLGIALGPAGVLALLLRGLPGAWARLGGLLGLVSGLLLLRLEPLTLSSSLLLVVSLGSAGVVVGLAAQAGLGLFRGRVWRGRGGSLADGLFLTCWLVGVILFNGWLLFAAVRYLLPALPPVLLLLSRALLTSAPRAAGLAGSEPVQVSAPRGGIARLGAFRRGLGTTGAALLATCPVLLLSLCVARADQRFADGVRTTVSSLPPSRGQRYFVGHWGWQYYLERAGARPLSEVAQVLPRAGDEVLVPIYAWPQDLPAGLKVLEVGRQRVVAPAGWRTFTVAGKACFYADMLAPGPTPVLLPFAWAEGDLEGLVRLRVQP